jgi:hypothetical protein
MKEAAHTFGVTPKTVYGWITKKIIPAPPFVRQGLKKVQVFPEDYMKEAARRLEGRRK